MNLCSFNRRTATTARPKWPALVLAGGLCVAQIHRARAGENGFSARQSYYTEDNNRIKVETQSALFKCNITPRIAVNGEFVHDAISGATPTGVPGPGHIDRTITTPGATRVPMLHMQDERFAGNASVELTLGRHHFTPQFSYSEEGDYVSRGAAMTYALDLNEKNTTLIFGWSHNWDTVYSDSRRQDKFNKEADEFIVGVNQLLGPKTLLTVNFVYGDSQGYLNDPYRRFVFRNVPDALDESLVMNPYAPTDFPEQRPDNRQKEVVFVRLTQFITPLHASVEGSYRFYHDSWDTDSHTVNLTWFQKLGKRVVVAPMFRYYWQTAVDFYYPSLPGAPNSVIPAGEYVLKQPSDPGYLVEEVFQNPVTPAYYSADYRLSALQTFTCGVSVNVKATDWLSFDASYERYIMEGLDHQTDVSAYPQADMFTIGARLKF